jgi:hypothetical protein
MSNISKLQAKHELWRRGFLRWKCHVVQQEMYDLFYNSEDNSILVWLLARQSGKSVLLAILALEAALKKPNSIIKLVTDTKIHVRSIFEKIFIELLEDCPEDVRPVYKTAEYTYYFGNGSQVQLAGSDNKHYEKLRGQKAALILVDEAGFCNDLDDMVRSVLLPTTTHTGGRIVLASTPPEEETHDFLKYIEEAEFSGKLIKKTIFDNPLLKPEQVKNIVDKMGGVTNERFRREYLCELVKSSSLSVVPEFNSDVEKEIVKEWPRPPFFDNYVSMDLGFQDMTALLFGYYDFRAGKIIIEDELPFHFKESDQHIGKLVKQIAEKENELWYSALTSELKVPYLRVSDINPIVTNEIYKVSKGEINFSRAAKDDKETAINNVRVLLASKKIIINPKCKTLIRHLKNVRWKKGKEEFARSVDDSHYDFVDALIYFVRTVQTNKNPYPKNYDFNLRKEDAYVASPKSFFGPSESINVYRKLLGNRKMR